MPDLYGALGVARDANKDAIRRAFRRASKAAHPDTGGTPQAFAMVCLAKDVLSDDARRQHYDQTGEAERAPIDTKEAQALEMASWAVQTAITEALQAQRDIATVDLIAAAIRLLDKRASDERQKKASWVSGVAVVEKALRRLKAKRGKQDRLGPLLRGSAEQLRRDISRVDAYLEAVAAAREIVAEHTYEFTPPAARNVSPITWNTSTSTA